MSDDQDAPEEPSATGSSPRTRCSGSCRGRCVRRPATFVRRNEDFGDAFVPTAPDDAWDRGPLFVVADGMGGHAAGEVASRVAVEAALESWATRIRRPRRSKVLRERDPQPPTSRCYDAALAPGRRGMGTTLVALTVAGHEAVIGHVGDSRAYLVRDAECTQLTADHSRVGEMLRMQLITPEQAAKHPARSQLTRSLGGDLGVQVDLARQPVEQADTIVLCTDGLWDVVLARGDGRRRRARGRAADPARRRRPSINWSSWPSSAGRLITSPPSSSPSPPTAHPRRRGASLLPSRTSLKCATSPGVGSTGTRSSKSSAKGAYAETYKARDTDTRHARRAEVPNPNLFADPHNFQRFRREAEIVPRLDHPNVLRSSRRPRQPHRALPRARVRRGREPPAARCASCGRCRSTWRSTGAVSSPTVIAYLHAHGIVHRDLKPENVLVADDGQLQPHGLRHRAARGGQAAHVAAPR